MSSASVSVNNKKVSSIGKGLLIFLGVEKEDAQSDLDYLAKKTVGLRIFKDNNNNMNLSVRDVGGTVLVVSQFTLCADVHKGHRPNFIGAASKEMADEIYQQYCNKLAAEDVPVYTGEFGAMMDVALVNNGPVTIILDSQHK